MACAAVAIWSAAMTSVSPSTLGGSGGGKAVPFPRGEERAWFEAAAEGKVALTRCRACGAHSVARVVCPPCWSTDVETVHGSGRGEVYSYTVLYRAGRPASRPTCRTSSP